MVQIKELLDERYAREGEHSWECSDPWRKICERVGKFLFPDDWKYYTGFMYNKEFIPSSPVLMNAGSDYPMMCSCFVLPIEDDIDAIMESLHKTVRIQKYGGGVGINFSPIRPEGSNISTTGGKASGPVSFMKFWNAAMDVIRQAGKRQGALMGVLNWNHPDIGRFLKAKKEDGVLPNFNLSVGLDENFWYRLQRNDEKAEKLLTAIATGIYNNGEPGVLFLDTINNNSSYDERIVSTNPCIWNSSYILTPSGLHTINEIEVGDYIWCPAGWTKVMRKQSAGVKPVFAYETTGGTFYGTCNHEVVTRDGKIPVDEADAIRVCPGRIPLGGYNLQAVVDGLVLGDGTYHKAGDRILLCVGENDQDYFDSEIAEFIGDSYSKDYEYKVKTTITPEELSVTYKREIPERYMKAIPERVKGLLRGLFSANGSIINNQRIAFKTASPKMREQVQLLLSSVGIRSYYTTNKPHEVEFRNGNYECKESYDVNITRDKYIFMDKIGFLQTYKQTADLVDSLDGNVYLSVKSKKYLGKEEVWDITVAYSGHTLWNQGLEVGNCGEIPIPPYGACCLGSINLVKCVDDRRGFDWSRLRGITMVATTILDRVIAKSWWPCPEIKEFEDKNWPLGIGVMGFADTLMLLGIPYDSNDARLFAENVMSEIQRYAEKEATALASTYGHAVPKAVTSIAPTGTISMLAGSVSYGIEPRFYHYGYKTVEQGVFKEINPILERAVENIEGRELTSEERDKIREAGSAQNIGTLSEGTCDVLKTALEIDPVDHILMQAAIQNYVDHSVSKTINLPHDTTIDKIETYIVYAHASGLKGITMYRNGSRNDEVITCPLGGNCS